MDEKKVTNRNLVPVLSIAGSDSSGGAGIQADLKTMLANDCYGMSAITALTAQNTMGVTGIMDVTPEFLRKQIDAVFLDIPPKAVKIGMVSDKALINTIAEALEDWHAENIVVDPVMVATSGSWLLKEDAISCLTEMLLPLATLITPNIPEAELLTGMTIQSKTDMEQAGRCLYDRFHSQVLIKGGHAIEDASGCVSWNRSDLVPRFPYRQSEYTWYRMYFILCDCVWTGKRIFGCAEYQLCQKLS